MYKVTEKGRKVRKKFRRKGDKSGGERRIERTQVNSKDQKFGHTF